MLFIIYLIRILLTEWCSETFADLYEIEIHSWYRNPHVYMQELHCMAFWCETKTWLDKWSPLYGGCVHLKPLETHVNLQQITLWAEHD